MSELEQPKFEHLALEKDIQRLAVEIREHKEKIGQPEMAGEEAVRSVLGARIQAQPAPEPQNVPLSPILPQYLQQEPAEIQLKVEQLVDLAFHKGIDASISEAKKYGPFILDALHDSLTAKIYDELKARKLL